MIKRFVVLAVVAVLSMGMTAMAETVTVGKSGADHTSIQAAIDAVNPTDGDPDVVQILDGAVYEEQVVIGGLPPIDVASGTWITDLFNQNRDPLTLRGPDSGDPPILDADPAALVRYGVFEDDPSDSFNAGIPFFGKDITVENVVIRQPGGNEAYAINGQGVDVTFRNVLFQPFTTAFEEDFINFNNSDIIAALFDNVGNEVLFEDCVFDGELSDGSKYNNTFVYYHGMEPAVKATDSFTFTRCSFQNGSDNLTRLRARGADQNDINMSLIDCLIRDNDGNSLQIDGGGIKTIDRCIFVNNVNGPDDPNLPIGDNAAVRIRGRSGRTGTVTISNSIFSNNASLDASTDAEGDQWATILVGNDGDDGPIVIDHCTFDGNGTAVRFADGAARPRTVTISNSIFSNNIGPAITGNGATPSYIGSGFEADLALTVKNCLFYSNGVDDPDIGTNVGAVSGDPGYANSDALGADPFELTTGSSAIDAADDSLTVGSQDIDGDARIAGSASDLGAQEFGAEPSFVEEFMLY